MYSDKKTFGVRKTTKFNKKNSLTTSAPAETIKSYWYRSLEDSIFDYTIEKNNAAKCMLKPFLRERERERSELLL